MVIRQNRGFTLIELMVTITVLAIIAMMAVPSFKNMVERQNLNRSAQSLVSVLNQARAQAVLIRSTVQVDPVSKNDDLKAKYAAVQANPADQQSLQQKKLFLWGPEGQTVLKGAVSPVVFELSGAVQGATADTSIMLCEKSGGTKSVTIHISRMGTIQQLEDGTCS